MKKLTKIRSEKACYYVCINGDIPFESESIKECKEYLINYIKNNKEEIEENGLYEYYVGMYSINIL